jgi:hypothetical protein
MSRWDNNTHTCSTLMASPLMSNASPILFPNHPNPSPSSLPLPTTECLKSPACKKGVLSPLSECYSAGWGSLSGLLSLIKACCLRRSQMWFFSTSSLSFHFLLRWQGSSFWLRTMSVLSLLLSLEWQAPATTSTFCFFPLRWGLGNFFGQAGLESLSSLSQPPKWLVLQAWATNAELRSFLRLINIPLYVEISFVYTLHPWAFVFLPFGRGE